MNSTVPEAQFGEAAERASSRLAGVLLARIAAGSGSEVQVGRDLRGLLDTPPSDEQWRMQVSRLVSVLVSAGHVVRHGDGVAVTADGAGAAMAFLGTRKPLPQGWPALRDGPLVALALGMKAAPATRLKALSKADGLRALIVETAWKLKLKGKPSPSRIRQALALLALERAFGNQVKTEIGAKSALSPKASRLLAGQLSATPRDYRTDARLVAALAMEAVGPAKGDLASLRTGVLRRFLRDGAIVAHPPVSEGAQHRARAERAKPRDGRVRVAGPGGAGGMSGEQHAPLPPTAGVAAVPVAPQRPDRDGFARAVKAAASARAEGWPGNRRAYVSLVWEVVRERHPEWAISEIEFKAMLTEAHRGGLVVLANADLKDKRRLKEVQDSAIPYKNTVWHFVRVED